MSGVIARGGAGVDARQLVAPLVRLQEEGLAVQPGARPLAGLEAPV